MLTRLLPAPRGATSRRGEYALLLGVLVSGNVQALPITDLLQTPGSAGQGFITSIEQSPYAGGGTRSDLIPLNLYEGEYFYLGGASLGFKLLNNENHRVDIFLARRLEGFPQEEVTPELEGMTYRKAGVDVGLSYRYQQTWGTLRASVLRDVGDYSAGSELDLGYSRDFHGDRWVLRPEITVAWRDANLNNYYFGVRPDEALPDRPAYAPGDGVNISLGLYASYRVWDNWRLLGGVSVTALDSRIRNSPIVRDDLQPAVYVGAVYDFGTALTRKDDGGVPLLVKVFYGQAAQDGCHLVRIVSLQCVSVDSDNRTSITGIHLGRPFLKRVHGWPLDFNGYVGLLYRDENGLQSNGVQVDAYMKAFYYGFPWSNRVNTRFGFGIGISYADEVPWPEVTSQAERDRPTSNLLNYLDPTLDVNVGDIFGVEGWKDTYFGVGVSHRSGIFASSRLLGSVDGGSNYIYGYLEKSF